MSCKSVGPPVLPVHTGWASVSYTFLVLVPIKAEVATLIVASLVKVQLWSIFHRQTLSFDRDKGAAAVHQSYTVMQRIECIVLTRQSFVSGLQSPDPQQVYKGLVLLSACCVLNLNSHNGQGKHAI